MNPTKLGAALHSVGRRGAANAEGLGSRLNDGRTLYGWDGYDFTLTAASHQQLKQLQDALVELASRRVGVNYEDVHDISRYAERIVGIGHEEPPALPQAFRKDDDTDWFPENIVYGLGILDSESGTRVTIPIAPEDIPSVGQAITTAIKNGESTVSIPGAETPLPTASVERAFEGIKKAHEVAQGMGKLPDPNAPPEYSTLGAQPGEGGTAGRGPKKAPSKTLLLRENFQDIRYIEARLDMIGALPTSPVMPASLNSFVTLKDHQSLGVIWLQHLFSIRDSANVRGGLLADDMGLGKTLQLLTFMSSLIERGLAKHPMLVIAPVSLLENWESEVNKFFKHGAFRLLVAHGHHLRDHRLNEKDIDPRLLEEDNLRKFLQPDWTGDANLVLTTYETVRDFEFSFADRKWSVVVCDESQKIKNPAAQMTRSLKRLNAEFRVACTGTPVENSLIDLWSLFDFIQPGLLGAMDEFSRTYRKPIECRSDEDRTTLDVLRKIIDPQVLRRMKKDVAKDLPKRIEVATCKSIPISMEQVALYNSAIQSFRQKSSVFAHHFTLLHYLRTVCTDPHPPGVCSQMHDVDEYCRRAPKMRWLLTTLEGVKEQHEKAIVFCEFKDIQRHLKTAIEQTFGLKGRVAIINGSTNTVSGSANSRKAQIDAFQESPGFGVIILSPVAVGFGVNIQAANHVIHYMRTWNPAKEDQATDRAYRIGQDKDVYVYYPTVASESMTTFEVKLDRLLATKRQLADDMLNGTGDIRPSDFSVLVEGDAGGSLADIDPPISKASVGGLSGRDFEGLVALLWDREFGVRTHVTPFSGDLGVDVFCLDAKRSALIQTKHSGREDSKIGWDAIKEVVAGHKHYQATYRDAKFDLVAVSNVRFNRTAVQQAATNNVELLAGEWVCEMLDKHSVRRSEILEKIQESSGVRFSNKAA